jgi:hypothetical protein
MMVLSMLNPNKKNDRKMKNRKMPDQICSLQICSRRTICAVFANEPEVEETKETGKGLCVSVNDTLSGKHLSTGRT